jgi:hypothetical protein
VTANDLPQPHRDLQDDKTSMGTPVAWSCLVLSHVLCHLAKLDWQRTVLKLKLKMKSKMMTWRLTTLVIAQASSVPQTIIWPDIQDVTLNSHTMSGWSCTVTEQFHETWEM